MREIKFRAWFVEGKEMEQCERIDLPNKSHHDDVIAMQYTGLKDKNGKEIYEGDIVNYEWIEDYLSQIVKWCEHGAKFGFQDKMDDPIYGVNYYDVAKRAEVIGNIYENPELLEIKK
jgi:uncharacterized phage protein (TIGR01671 family)